MDTEIVDHWIDAAGVYARILLLADLAAGYTKQIGDRESHEALHGVIDRATRQLDLLNKEIAARTVDSGK